MVNWTGEVREAIIKEIKKRGSDKFATTRAVWYYCGDVLRLFPRTEKTYQRLNALTVDMRKKGEIPWGYFSVTRGVDGASSSRYWEPEEFFNFYKRSFLKCGSRYHLPKWYNQEYYVEVWVEKKGLLPNIERYVRDLDVQVRALEGFPPWEFAHEKVGEIKEFLEDRSDDAEIVVLYLGDLDPSGLDIDRQIGEVFGEFNLDVQFKRVGLLPDLVESFDLPTLPEPETLEKIHKDPRYPKYHVEYGETFTELDAWQGVNPGSLRETIREAILRFYDEDIYEAQTDLADENRSTIEELLNDAKGRLEA